MLVAFGLAIVTTFTQAASGEVLKQEPPPGQLHPGQKVLVDDGSCPQGQIKQVVGGSNINGATGASIRGGAARQISCVRRDGTVK
jgi:hypothetical protein